MITIASVDCLSVLAVRFVIAACGFVISAAVLRAAQEGSAVAYSTNDLGMQFASVPAGQFPMGCSEGVKPVECSADEKPRHTVQITRGFEIGKTEVTQKQWQAVMGSNPSQYKGDDPSRGTSQLSGCAGVPYQAKRAQ